MKDEAIDRLMESLGLRREDAPDVSLQLRPRHIPAIVRRKVLERDGSRCRYCGATEDLQIDHIHPYARGGSNRGNNLQALCQTCNQRRYTDRCWASLMEERNFNPEKHGAKEEAAIEELMRELNLSG